MKTICSLCIIFAACLWVSVHPASGEEPRIDENAKILFLAGPPSHGFGSHEHYAGCMYLAKSLQAAFPDFTVDVIKHQWPGDPSVFEDVDSIIMYSDGGGRHPVLNHLEQVEELSARGVGIVCIHYAVEVPKGEPGDHLLNWIGGYFETHWSVNPHWKAHFEKLPDHPITRGVEPFAIQDEWYYHMRFRPDMDGVTPILSAVPPASTLERPDGPHSGNPHVRATAGELQHVGWAFESDDSPPRRGFGFTGGHFHWNWGDPDFQRIVLNAIVWTAGQPVPESGVPIDGLDKTTLLKNQDYQPPENFDLDETLGKFGIGK